MCQPLDQASSMKQVPTYSDLDMFIIIILSLFKANCTLNLSD